MIPFFGRIRRTAQSARKIWRDRRRRHGHHDEPPAGPQLTPGLGTRFRRLRPTTWQEYVAYVVLALVFVAAWLFVSRWPWEPY